MTWIEAVGSRWPRLEISLHTPVEGVKGILLTVWLNANTKSSEFLLSTKNSFELLETYISIIEPIKPNTPK